jgi:hypothetical protein
LDVDAETAYLGHGEFIMNRHQKIVVAIGVAMVILSGLFPPYEGEIVGEDKLLRPNLGHHFFFAPPTPEYVRRAIFGKTASISGVNSAYYSAHYRARIVLSEVVVQLSVIVLTTVGVTLLLTKQRT